MKPPVPTTVLLLLAAASVPAQLAVREYLIPRAGAFPHDPAVGDDGIALCTDQLNSFIGRFNPVDETFTDWPTPTPNSGPHGITVAPDGYVWYTAQSTGRLGRVHPATGAITEYVLPAGANRPHTPIAHQGAIWFHAEGTSSMIAFDPRAERFETVPIPTPGAIVRHMVCDYARGTLWLALSGTRRIGKLQLGPPVVLFGSACAGSTGVPDFAATGAPRIGTTVTFSVSNTAATLGVLFLGLSRESWNGQPLPIDLGPYGAAGCLVLVSWDVPLFAGPPGSVPVPLPAEPALGGVVVHLQWALLGDPSGRTVVTTQGATITLIGL